MSTPQDSPVEPRIRLIDAIDDRRFDSDFPNLLYKDIELIVDNYLLPEVNTLLLEARQEGQIQSLKETEHVWMTIGEKQTLHWIESRINELKGSK